MYDRIIVTGKFVESAQIFNANGEPVGDPVKINWSSGVEIRKDSGGKFYYSRGFIGGGGEEYKNFDKYYVK